MFDIAFSELVLIGLVALVVLGPRRLQEAARTAGRWMARLRRFVDDVKRDMDAELRQGELAELRNVQQQLMETRDIIEKGTAGALAGLASIQPPAEPDSAPPLPAIPDSPAPPPAATAAPAATAKSSRTGKIAKSSRTAKTAKAPRTTAHGRAKRKRR